MLRAYRFLVLLGEKFPEWFQRSGGVRVVVRASNFFPRLFQAIFDPTTVSAGQSDLFKGFTVYAPTLMRLVDAPVAVLKQFLSNDQYNLFKLDPIESSVNVASASILASCYRRVLKEVAPHIETETRDFLLHRSLKLCAAGMTPTQALLANDMMSICLQDDNVNARHVLEALTTKGEQQQAHSGDAEGAVPSQNFQTSRLTLGALWYDFFREPLDREGAYLD